MATRDINLLKDIYCNCQQLSNSNDGAGAVPAVHDHGPRRRRTSAIHLSRSTQGGQVRARWCVRPQLQSQRLSLVPASSTFRSWQACWMNLSFAVFSYCDGAVLVSQATGYECVEMVRFPDSLCNGIGEEAWEKIQK